MKWYIFEKRYNNIIFKRKNIHTYPDKSLIVPDTFNNLRAWFFNYIYQEIFIIFSCNSKAFYSFLFKFQSIPVIIN